MVTNQIVSTAMKPFMPCISSGIAAWGMLSGPTDVAHLNAPLVYRPA